MKSFLPVVVLLTISIISGCKVAGPDMSTEKEVTWSYAKGPSGRCYEILTFELFNSHGSSGFMGMSEIPCSEMK